MKISLESTDGPVLLNKRLRIREPEFQFSHNNFLMLPNHICSAPEYLCKLIKIRESITTPPLCEFLDTLFSDINIASCFISLPASVRHHHSIASGLLIHSVECAETANNQVYKSVADRDITVVAALLHDIGKVKSYTTNLKTTQLGRMVAHDHLTLEVCAPALSELDKLWPDGANTLRHIWTCRSEGAKYGFKPNTPLAIIVKFADRLSVGLYEHEEAFKTRFLKSGLVWDGSDYFWQLPHQVSPVVRRKLCF